MIIHFVHVGKERLLYIEGEEGLQLYKIYPKKLRIRVLYNQDYDLIGG